MDAVDPNLPPFAAVLAAKVHLLKNILHAVQGEVNALPPFDNVLGPQARLRQMTEAMNRQLLGLLRLYKLEHGQGFNPQDTDLNDLIDDIREGARPFVHAERAHGAPLNLHFEVQLDDWPSAWLDRQALADAMITLIDNASRYAAHQVLVRIVQGPQAGTHATLQLEVHDDGPGFPAAFDPAQARITPQGTGLGLALAQAIARAHWRTPPDAPVMQLGQSECLGGAKVMLTVP